MSSASSFVNTPPSRSLSVTLQSPQGTTLQGTLLAEGCLPIPPGTNEQTIRQAIDRIESYSGSQYILGLRVSLAVIDTPISASDLTSQQKDEVIELAKQESKDKDAVIEDLRAEIGRLKKQMEGKTFDIEPRDKTKPVKPVGGHKKVSTENSAKSKPATKNSKAKAQAKSSKKAK